MCGVDYLQQHATGVQQQQHGIMHDAFKEEVNVVAFFI
jgi:hypothetical protein